MQIPDLQRPSAPLDHAASLKVAIGPELLETWLALTSVNYNSNI